ncbi:MAG: tRNA lysidine(34) synthetase TilS, partial [Firmicutes bacterium]|nr:tRNA lysidine(34) synthetase TilS [Bacillota bacterium]
MENLVEFIKQNGLIKEKEYIGVAVSGGGDSMCLLNFLMENQKELGCKLCVINVNHKLRKESDKESAFVAKFCKDNNVTFFRHTINVAEYAKANSMNIEAAARLLRYQCFEQTAKKEKLDKVAVAHHMSDQAETVLLHLFRGSGISGTSGMELKRGIYIRPLLYTEKTAINAYLYNNQIKYVTDQSNFDNSYSRNFLRNEVLPLITREWRNAERNIFAFSQSCREDEEYINTNINSAAIIAENNLVRVPLNYFSYSPAIVTRIIFKALNKINAKN